MQEDSCREPMDRRSGFSKGQTRKELDMSMNEFIPADFSPLADWDHRNRANNDGHSAEWKTLSDALKAGEIPGFKLANGRWYVHSAKASEYLAKQHAAPVEAATKATYSSGINGRHVESAVIALCEINNGITLMQATLERLTAAVESIATQPKAEMAGTWRDMNGESL